MPSIDFQVGVFLGNFKIPERIDKYMLQNIKIGRFLGEMGAIEKTGEKLGDLLSNVRERLPDFTFARLFIQEYAAVLTYKYSSTEG